MAKTKVVRKNANWRRSEAKGEKKDGKGVDCRFRFFGAIYLSVVNFGLLQSLFPFT